MAACTKRILSRALATRGSFYVFGPSRLGTHLLFRFLYSSLITIVRFQFGGMWNVIVI